MRYIIYGAGGIGSVVGGFLFQVGLNVVLVGRPAHVSAIKENGLSIISSRGRFRLKIPAVEKVSDIKPITHDDVVLLTAKSQHTYICLSELKAADAPVNLPICCMQNSIINEPQAIRIFDKIYGAMIMIPAFYITPGEVIHYRSGGLGYIDIGCYPSGIDSVCAIIASDLQKAGFVVNTQERVMRSKGGKCLTSLGNFSVIKSSEKQKQEFLMRIRSEAETVWTAAGIEFESHEEFQQRMRAVLTSWELWEAPEQKGMNWGGSGWQTLARKAGSSETPKLNGDVVYLGKELGISTPANYALCEISTTATLEGKEPESIPYMVLEKLYQSYKQDVS